MRILPPPEREPEDPREAPPEEPREELLEEPRETDEDPVLGEDLVTVPLEDRPDVDLPLGDETKRYTLSNTELGLEIRLPWELCLPTSLEG